MRLISKARRKKGIMGNEMSIQYLLTLLSDHVRGLEQLLEKIKEQDGGYAEWKSMTMETFLHSLGWLKLKVNSRLEQSGISPDSLVA